MKAKVVAALERVADRLDFEAFIAPGDPPLSDEERLVLEDIAICRTIARRIEEGNMSEGRAHQWLLIDWSPIGKKVAP